MFYFNLIEYNTFICESISLVLILSCFGRSDQYNVHPMKRLNINYSTSIKAKDQFQ